MNWLARLFYERRERVLDYKLGKLELGTERSPEWPKVRAAFLKDHPACAICNRTENLNVHHIKPFHKYPNLELDPTNLMTLCEAKGGNHHLWWGHLGDFKSWNENVPTIAPVWNEWIKDRPY